MQSNPFVYTKPGAFETGEMLTAIVARKESERLAGNGIFWWGVGNSLGPRLAREAQAAGGTLPLLFLIPKRPTPARREDAEPDFEFHWTKWQDAGGEIAQVPSYAHVISRGDEEKRRHYALVCRSQIPIRFDKNGPSFDLQQCVTAAGKAPGTSQVTALVWGDPTASPAAGGYSVVFKASLIYPWQATLVAFNKRPLGR